jgi:hypothetical protein
MAFPFTTVNRMLTLALLGFSTPVTCAPPVLSKKKHQWGFVGRDGIFCQGVHAFIQEHWPSLPQTQQKQRRAGTERPSKRQCVFRCATQKTESGSALKQVSGHQFIFGRGNGILVDQHLTRLVAHATSHTSKALCMEPSQKMWQKQYLETKNQTIETKQQIAQRLASVGIHFAAPALLDRVHPMALTVLTFLIAKGLRPVQAQVPVSHPTRRLATAIDQVWFDPKKNTLWLIEIKKTQSTNYFDGFGQTIKAAPFADMTDCLFIRHQLQLAIAENLFLQTWKQPQQSQQQQQQHNRTKRVQSMVVRVHTEGITREILGKDVRSRMATFLA